MIPISSRKIFQTVKISIAVLFLLGLWVYQLPRSPVERVLMSVFRPIQKIMFTDRQYQMYAPDPLATKKVSFLLLKTKRGSIEFLKPPTWNPFAREKWNNFIYQMGRSLAGDLSHYPEEEGRLVFQKFSEKLCRERDLEAVEIQYRKVQLWELREEIVWETPKALARYYCTGLSQ